MARYGKISVIGANSFTRSKIKKLVLPGNSGSNNANPDFISEWDTTQAGSASDTVVLPLLSGGTYSGTIDWGDGSTSVLSYANRSHTYAAGGTYTITISGSDIQGFQFNNGGDRRKITDVSNFGNLTITTNSSFRGCSNLDVSAIDAPTLSSTIATSNLFRDCTNLTTPNFSSWDVSSCTDFRSCFYNCTNFNGNIDNWDMSSALTLGNPSFDSFGMLSFCSSFNRDISGWDVSNVTVFTGLFRNCIAFDQNLSIWNMSSAQNVRAMFSGCTIFNNGGSDGIKNWDVSNVTIFGNSSPGLVGGMFASTSAFNQPIGSWTINTSTSVVMSQMFAESAFNQDISNWDVSAVTTVDSMFQLASYNQPLNAWNTSSITTMRGMFNTNSVFDQDISNFDVTSVTDLTNFLQNGTLSTVNYDALLVGWEATLQAAFPGGAGYTPTINIDFGSSTYTSGSAAATARASLISNFGWTITDGGAV